MIKCKKCGNPNLTFDPICYHCATEFELTEAEKDQLLSEAADCMKKRRYEEAVDLYRFLGSVGVMEGERVFAFILERGVLVPRDLDMAMKYYFSAAKKGDAHSAYRYSRLIARANSEASDFWLSLAAVLGEESAYGDAVALYDRLGDDSTASYYCALLADKGDTDATVEMARRHLYGKGVKKNEAYAKWYMDRIAHTPLYAMKLYYRLRAVDKAEKPALPTFKNYDKVMRGLIAEARRMNLDLILLKLSEIFADCSAPDASVSLANLYIEGTSVRRDVEKGIELLERAKKAGSAQGTKSLGDLFASGEHVEKDVERAIEYYKHAATLRNDGAYESIGDFFLDGELTEPDPYLALTVFEKGAAEGDKNCAAKAYAIKREREKNYFEACEIERSDPKAAFPLFEKSVKAGYLPAHAKIAPYYEKGIGTKVDRRAAFHHYKTAVEAGDKRALFDLGRCYAHGIGTRFNFKAASAALSLAQELGQGDADAELRRIYENKKKHMLRSLYSTAMSMLYKKDFAEAKRLLEICVSLGSTEATYSLGCLYEFGVGIPADRRTALNYYKAAYAGGYSDYDQSQKHKILKVTK